MPRFPLDDRYELLLAGEWVDITGYVYDRDEVTITRGRSAEAQEADPSEMTLTLDNRDGRFSPRNPTSPYYGILGRNTQIRASLPGPSRLVLPDAATGYISTPDSAALSVTGDLDVRIEVDLDEWLIDGDLIGKAALPTDQVSWGLFTRDDGDLQLYWSTDGTSTVSARSVFPIAVPSKGRLAVRATLDVDNGDGGWTAAFYTAATIDGPWMPLGPAVTESGTTSIFDGTAPVQIGRTPNFTFTGRSGAVYAAQIRDGIDGTLVADVDLTGQAAADTSFDDDQGNTWTLTDCHFDDRLYRFHGEVAEWPATLRMGGHDAHVKLAASGIKRRLTQNAPTLRSALFRNIAALDGLVSYWPFEDGDRAQLVASSDDRTAPMTVSGSPQMGSYSNFTASDPLPVAGTGRFSGAVARYTAAGELLIRLFLFVDEPVTAETNLLRIETSGTASRWTLTLLDDGDIRTTAHDTDNAELVNSRWNTLLNSRGFVLLDLQLVQDGADIDWTTRVVDFVNTDTVDDGFSWASDLGTITGKTFGSALRITVGGGTLGDVIFGHLFVASDISAVWDDSAGGDAVVDFVYYGVVARNGENPTRRMGRLCAEEGVRFAMVSNGVVTGNFVTMGDQGNQTLVDLLQETADTDGGVLFEPRDFLGFAYRTRAGMYNQPAAVTLDYGAKQVAGDLVPVDDDRWTINDLTVKREAGSSMHVEEITGPLSVAEPPEGVGRYAGEVTLSMERDDQLPDQAGWRLHLGTVDEPRFPTLTVNLRATGITDELAAQILALDVGDRIVLTGIPEGMPRGDVSMLVQGYAESMRRMGHEIEFNLAPESPWHVGQVETDDYDRLDTESSTLDADATSTATSLSVATTGAPWTTDSGDMPFDVLVAGERVTVTAVTGTASPQTFTVERSVNGVVKAQTAGAQVRLPEPVYVAL